MQAPNLKNFAAKSALWLTGLLLVLPFTFNFVLDLPGKTIPFFAFHWIGLAIGFAAIAVLPWAGSTEHGIRIPYSVLPLLGLIGICLYQFATLDVPYSAPYITYITYMIWAIALFILGATLNQTLGPDRVLQTIAWFSLIGALPAALTGLIQMGGVPAPLQSWIISSDHAFPIGNVAHPNFFTCHVMLGLLALTYLFGIRKISLHWLLVSFILLITAIALSPSRTVYLYFLIVIGWSAWAEWRTRNIASKRFFLVTLFSFGLFLLLQWGFLPFIERFTGLFTESASRRLLEFQDDGQLFTRIDAWRAAWQMFTMHPFEGGGIANYPWHHFLLTQNATPHSFSNPHNLILFYLATSGILGTTLLLLFLSQIVNRLRLLQHDCRYWIATVFMLVIFIYSMLEFPLWLPAFLGVTAFLCGVLQPAGWAIKPFYLTAKSIYAVFIAICALLLLDTLEDYRKLAWSDTGRLPPNMVDNFARNGTKNPWLRPYAEVFFLSGKNLENPDLSDVLLRINTRQIHWQPTQRALFRQTILLSMAGKDDESVQMFKKIILMYPRLTSSMIRYCEKHQQLNQAPLCDIARSINTDD